VSFSICLAIRWHCSVSKVTGYGLDDRLWALPSLVCNGGKAIGA